MSDILEPEVTYDMGDMDLFFGSKSTLDIYKKTHNIEDYDDDPESDEDSKEETHEEVKSSATVFSKNTLVELDEDTLRILKRTRTAHDYSVIYMQSSLEFYDQYYNEQDVPKELKEARKIRRIYKVYGDYLNAIRARNDYMDYLVEKHGGEESFSRKLSMGTMTDWIPYVPILSKRCPDYDFYIAGVLPCGDTSNVATKEEIKEVLDAMNDEVADLELEIETDVETNMGKINRYNEIMEAEYNTWIPQSKRSSKSVTFKDLDELNNTFKSWYKPETGKVEREYFRNSPENIRKRYLEKCAFEEPGLLTRICSGEEIDNEEEDLNSMVYDEGLGRNITLREHLERENIRLMSQFGWSEIRLLNYANVGSKLEKMKRTTRARKKRKRASTEFYDEAMSENGTDPIFSDSDYLSNTFMSMLRGDN